MKKLIVLLSFIGLLVASPASANYAFVQATGTRVAAGATNINLKFVSTTTAANAYVVGVGCLLASVTSSITDSEGNTWQKATPMTFITSGSSNNYGIEIWYALNIVGSTKDSITSTFSGSCTQRRIWIHEYSGLATTNALDATSSLFTSGSGGGTFSSGTSTTASANELVFGLGASDAGLTSAGAGFTLRVNAGSESSEDKNATTTGSYSATFPFSGTDQGIVQMATFKIPATASTANTQGFVVQGGVCTVQGSQLTITG